MFAYSKIDIFKNSSIEIKLFGYNSNTNFTKDLKITPTINHKVLFFLKNVIF